MDKAHVFCNVEDFKYSKGWFCRFKCRLLKRIENMPLFVRDIITNL